MRTIGVLVLVGVLAAGGCAAPAPGPAPAPESASASAPAPTPTPEPSSPAPSVSPGAAVDPFDALSLEQRVGLLFVVGSPADAAGEDALVAIQQHFAGGVFLSGRSVLGVDATRAVVDQLTAASASDLPLLVATDQEGGEVQVLRGPGFSEIPSAVEQGTLDPGELRDRAVQWGAELAAAGVNLDLAPIADVVASAAAAPGNAPIGAYHREFGYDQATVEQHAGAVVAGLRSAGVLSTPKHFPGLGLVTLNTDTHAGVTDTQTDAGSPSVGVFRTLIGEGACCIMMSTANYALLDPGVPAAFSPVIVEGLLRHDLGFDGVVITDDVSAATQVQAWTPAERAILAIRAGDDLVLVSASPEQTLEMMDAVIATALTDPEFAARVDESARRVLALKVSLAG
ncbi:MAG TPA: glycoside hydrolase family 3 N-terminal domain-containing protein [Pseudolysinimonas sp.]|nr:glycoside hydrolase family 3 N-terminal domain-containing protein [Pseudolysinimonas sp.]